MTLTTAGSIKEKPKGSLANFPHEGVSVTLGCWSRDEGSKLNKRGFRWLFSLESDTRDGAMDGGSPE
jgi:hypothetical protein